METAQKPRGGRPKGSGNRAKFNIEAFIRKVEQADGRKLEEIVASVLKDPKTKAAMVVKLLAYRYGEPQARVEVDGSSRMEHTIRFAESPPWRREPEIVEPQKPAPQLMAPASTPLTNTVQLEVVQNGGMPRSTRPSSNKGLF